MTHQEILSAIEAALSGEDSLNEIFRRLGAAFLQVPEARHWSELPPDEQAAWLEAAPVLKEQHTDWIIPGIPRTATSWFAPLDYFQTIEGTSAPDDIPEKGEWGVWPGYVAGTLPSGTHYRIGFRPDMSDTLVREDGKTEHLINFPSLTFRPITAWDATEESRWDLAEIIPVLAGIALLGANPAKVSAFQRIFHVALAVAELGEDMVDIVLRNRQSGDVLERLDLTDRNLDETRELIAGKLRELKG